MIHKSYRKLITLITVCLFTAVNAQKFEKKYSENFKTNKDVQVAIDASNSEINVTTWNKNQVQINAFIEVEGVEKEVAEKYFKEWNFEALGNKSKIQLTSKGSTSYSFKNDFVFFDNMDFNIDIPEIDFSNIEAIVLPDMDFDFDFDFGNLMEDIDDHMGKNGKYEFRWKDDENDIEINTKKEWEAFKKTKKYRELKKRMKVDKEKMHIEFAKSKEKLKKQFAKSRIELKTIKREELEKSLTKAKRSFK